MRERTIARIIAVTYAALIGAWLVTLGPARRLFANQPLIEPGLEAAIAHRTPRLLNAAGVLLVFLANILTLGMFVGSLFSPRVAVLLPRLRVPLPRAVNLVGACLCMLGGVWGTLVLIYNPGYTPFFIRRKEAARLATGGPYAIVRHPRYALEAAMNIAIAALTGTWLPLIGILGWPALRRQAQLEEADLLRAAPTAYSDYRSRTGAFLPRL